MTWLASPRTGAGSARRRVSRCSGPRRATSSTPPSCTRPIEDPLRPFDDPAVISPRGDGLVTRRRGPRRRRVRVGLRAGRGGARRRHRRRRLPRRLARPARRRRRAHRRAPRRGRARAAVGPCAGRDAYEVGPDVAEPLAEQFGPTALNGRNADLAACAAIALERAGVGAVDVAGLCTISDPERFFSYRRDGRACGRQAVIAHLGAA